MQLYFPHKKDIVQKASAAFSIEERAAYVKNCEELEERAEKLSKDCCLEPSKVTKNDVVSLAKDTYSLTVQLFNAKIAGGETLYREERAIYDLCKSELKKYSSASTSDSIEVLENSSGSQPVGSIWGSLFNAVELVRNCIDQIKEWFDLTTEKDKADRYLVNAGHEILPLFMPTEDIQGVAIIKSSLQMRYRKAFVLFMMKVSDCSPAAEDCGSGLEKRAAISLFPTPELM